MNFNAQHHPHILAVCCYRIRERVCKQIGKVERAALCNSQIIVKVRRASSLSAKARDALTSTKPLCVPPSRHLQKTQWNVRGGLPHAKFYLRKLTSGILLVWCLINLIISYRLSKCITGVSYTKIRDQCVYSRPIIQWIPSSISVAQTLTCHTSPYVRRINPSWAPEI